MNTTMKKVIVLLSCVLAISSASAQGKKGWLVYELGIGTSHYGNYSPMSVFSDPTGNYSLLATAYVSFGYRHNDGWFVGLTLNNDGGNTSFQSLNESFTNSSVMIDLRKVFELGDRIELEAGVDLGLLIHRNSFDYFNDHFSFTRLGFSACSQMGVNYLIKENQTIGIRALFPCYGAMLSDKPELPTGLLANDKTQTIGYSLQVGYGIRF